jgi:bifunctional lysine-specific demethylase and histidyl-hydroxylase NO66
VRDGPQALGPPTLWSSDAPLRVRAAAPEACQVVIRSEDVERRLMAAAAVFPQARLVRPGGTLHPRHYAVPKTPWGVGSVPGLLDPVAVFQRLREGCGVALGDAHRWHAPLARWVWSLEWALSRRVTANVYRTSPGSPAFAPHYDQQDIVVVQVEGTKRWRVHVPTIRSPTEQHPCPPEGVAPGALLLDTVLAPGDLLVLPRGFVHEALAQDGPSLHVSMTARPWTTHDLRQEAGLGIETDDENDRRHRELDLREPCGGVVEPELVGAAMRILDRFVETRQPDLEGALADAVGAATLEPGSTLVTRRSLTRLRPGDAGIVVLAPGRRLVFPPVATPALRRALSGAPFEPTSLPGLRQEEGLELSRHLLNEALVTRSART